MMFVVCCILFVVCVVVVVLRSVCVLCVAFWYDVFGACCWL